MAGEDTLRAMAGEDSGRRVYDGRVVKLDVDRVELPGGARVELEVVRHPGAAAVVPFVSADHVVLIHQFRHAAGGTIWEVPAGKLDGEAPQVCAARELEEEAGLRAGRLERLGAIWTTPGFTDERIHLFAAYELERVPQRLQEDEVLEVVEMPLARAVEMIWSGELSDAKSALALIHAAHRLGRL
jgi:ADP-ribose pyrophosphatase